MSSTESPIPIFNSAEQYRSIRDELLEAVTAVMDSQGFVLGPQVTGFETEIAEFLGAEHAVSCASGTDALILSLKALGIGSGDEVIVPVFTYFATAAAVCHTGAKPVFVDIDPETYCIDVERAKAAVTSWTRAIIPVHLFGQCANMDAVQALASEYNLKIVEDAAQAVGAKCRDRSAGTMGDTGAFSFYPTKNLGSCGEGGLVTTADAAVAERVRLLRAQGDAGGYKHVLIGTNSRMHAIQAAALRVKLKHLGEWNDLRRQRADKYRELLADTPVEPPVEAEGNYHIYNLFVVRCPERDKLLGYLNERKIGARVYYPIALHQLECFDDLGYSTGDFPAAEKACQEVMALPFFPEITEEQQKRVADVIGEFYGK